MEDGAQSELPRKAEESDIFDAGVELCISASEAVVLSELAGCESELLSANSILEVTLRLKQARNQSQLDVVDGISANLICDETDQLSDLDDDTMVDLFDDAGICFTQVIGTPDDSNTAVLLSPNGNETDSEETEQVNTASYYGSMVQCEGLDHTISIDEPDHRDKDLLLEVNPEKQSKASLRVGKYKPVQDDKDVAYGGGISRKAVPNPFILESSSISETPIITSESLSIHKPEEGPEVIISSNKWFENEHKSVSWENVRQLEEDIVLSEDIVGSSSFATIDSLCSVVPCSITSQNASIDLILENGFSDTTARSCLCAKADPSAFVHAGVFPYFSIRDPSGVHRRVASLEAYSTALPAQNTNLGGTGTLLHLKNHSCLMSSNNENAAFPNMKTQANFGREAQPRSTSPAPFESIADTGLFPSSDYGIFKSAIEIHDCSEFPVNDTHIWSPNDERCQTLFTSHGNLHRIRICSPVIDSGKQDGRPTEFSRNLRSTIKSTYRASKKEAISTKSHKILHSDLYTCSFKENRYVNKRVRFSNNEPSIIQDRKRPLRENQQSLHVKNSEKKKVCDFPLSKKGGKILNCLGQLNLKDEKELIFHGFQFLLTGLSKNSKMEVQTLIRRYGGIILPNIPPISNIRGKRSSLSTNLQCVIVLSGKKVPTSKFLYGCAIGALLLDPNWLSDCIQTGFVLPPRKYMILQYPNMDLKHAMFGFRHRCSEVAIFDKLGAMLYGKPSFCSKYSSIIMHGGGQVFKSLKCLVQSLKNEKNSNGVILVENESSVSRHLKHFALEYNLQTVPISWIINSLFSGKLLPLKLDRSAPLHRIKMPTFPLPRNDDMSEEI